MPCKALSETPILVEVLAEAIGTSVEDACKSLEEYDSVPRNKGFTGDEGLGRMLDDLVATG